MKRLSIALAFIALFVFSINLDCGPSAATNSNWPQWRGPDSQGVSNDKNLPTEWSATKNVLWKTEIPGRGFSHLISWDNRVFLTADIEGGLAPDTHKPADPPGRGQRVQASRLGRRQQA